MAQNKLPPGAWLSGYSLPDNWPRGVAAGALMQVARVGGAAFGAATNPPVGPPGPSFNPPVGPPGPSHNPPVGPPGPSHNPPVGPPSAGGIPRVGSFASVSDAAMIGSPGIFQPGLAPGEWILARNGPVLTEPPIPWIGIDPSWTWLGGAATLQAQALRKVRERVCPPVDFRMPREKVMSASQHVDPLWRWDEPYRVAAVVAELMGRLAVKDTTLWWRPLPSAQAPVAHPLFVLSPADASFDYSDQIDRVLRAAVEREDRMAEILTQATDIGLFFDALTGLDRSTMPALRQLVEVAWEVCTQLVMLVKNNVAAWRPFQRSARIVPVIVTPGHGSLPSGHATMAELTASLLHELLYRDRPDLRGRADMLERLARRIAFNREVAGVHFPMDSFVGHALGAQLARSLVALAEGAPQPATGHLALTDRDVFLSEIFPPPPSPAGPPGTAIEAKEDDAAPHDVARLWQILWNAAKVELASHRV